MHRVIEKPRYVDSQLKGCGLYVFDQHIFDAIRRTPRTAMRDEYEITDSIQILINDGYVVHHHPIVERDLNLTKPEDLLTINLIELARRGLTQLVGESGHAAAGHAHRAQRRSASGVIIRHPIRITNTRDHAERRRRRASTISIRWSWTASTPCTAPGVAQRSRAQ